MRMRRVKCRAPEVRHLPHIRAKRGSYRVQHKRSPQSDFAGISAKAVGLRGRHLQKPRNLCSRRGRNGRSHSFPDSNSANPGIGQGGFHHQIEFVKMGERAGPKVCMAARLRSIQRERIDRTHSHRVHQEPGSTSQKNELRQRIPSVVEKARRGIRFQVRIWMSAAPGSSLDERRRRGRG